MEKQFVKKFDSCPGCGSTERYFEGVIKELHERGLLDKNITCFDFQLRQGVPLPPQKIALLPFGSELPAFSRIWDTCCECGMVYSIHLEMTVAKKSVNLAQPLPPMNRAERRQIEHANHGIKFPTNNPFMS